VTAEVLEEIDQRHEAAAEAMLQIANQQGACLIARLEECEESICKREVRETLCRWSQRRRTTFPTYRWGCLQG
jgi:hypothetical protein